MRGEGECFPEVSTGSPILKGHPSRDDGQSTFESCRDPGTARCVRLSAHRAVQRIQQHYLSRIIVCVKVLPPASMRTRYVPLGTSPASHVTWCEPACSVPSTSSPS